MTKLLILALLNGFLASLTLASGHRVTLECKNPDKGVTQFHLKSGLLYQLKASDVDQITHSGVRADYWEVMSHGSNSLTLLYILEDEPAGMYLEGKYQVTLTKHTNNNYTAAFKQRYGRALTYACQLEGSGSNQKIESPLKTAMASTLTPSYETATKAKVIRKTKQKSEEEVRQEISKLTHQMDMKYLVLDVGAIQVLGGCTVTLSIDEGPGTPHQEVLFATNNLGTGTTTIMQLGEQDNLRGKRIILSGLCQDHSHMMMRKQQEDLVKDKVLQTSAYLIDGMGSVRELDVDMDSVANSRTKSRFYVSFNF